MQSSQKITKKILIARPAPLSPSSPYLKLEEKYDVSIDFKPFMRTEPVSLSEFRKFKSKILACTALIFTNKSAIDHFFQLAKLANIKLSDTVKYFCFTDILGNYLQKYILVKKRKILKGKKGLSDFFTKLKKHKKEKFLIASSDVSRKDIIEFLKEYGCSYTKIVVYKILNNDLTKMIVEDYDIIVFFSLLDVKSFVKNFPKFVPGHTRMAVFGSKTAKALKNAGFPFHIYAPKPGSTSIVDALDIYLKQ